jgi:hypothetical protein
VAAGVSRGFALFVVVCALLTGCTGPGIGINQPSAAAPATPPVGVTGAIDAARSAVAAAVQPAGLTLTEADGYTPGEPQPVQALPRQVYQLNFGGPNEGYVVIYDAGSNDAALNAGSAFADYLRTFGHSNYPGDAKFTLNAVGNALVMFWWSPGRSTEPDRAAQAFDLIRTVGQPIEVLF